MSIVKTLEELKLVHAYKHGHYAFPHPKDILIEFTNRLDKAGYVYHLSIKVDKEGGAKLDDDTNIETWGRGFVIARIYAKKTSEILPSGEPAVVPVGNESYLPSVGISWAFDITKKVMKVFRGVNTSACTNLAIFNVEDVYIRTFGKPRGVDKIEKERSWNRLCRDLTEDLLIKVDEYIAGLEENFNTNIGIIEKLNSKFYRSEEIYTLIGKLYTEFAIVDKFDITTFNEGCRLIFNGNYDHPLKELYALGTDTLSDEPVLSLLTLYQAFTQRITDDKVELDYIDEKTLEVSQMLLPLIEEV